MQVNCIGGIADGAENGALAIVGVGQHRQCLIAVRCDHDVIVGIAAAVTVIDDDTARRPFDRRHGAAEPKLIPECRRQFLHVAPAAALHGAPDRAIILQQAVVAEEGNKILGGEVEHLA